MKLTFLALGLALLVVVAGVFSATSTQAITPPTAVVTYAVTDANGLEVEAAVDPVTGAMVLGFLFSGDVTAYSGTIPTTPGAQFFLTKSSVYGSSSMPDTLRVAVTQTAGSLTVSMKGVTYILDTTSESIPGDGYHCTTSTGTGACDNVVTDKDWWRCFRCCWVLGCG